MFFYEGTIIYIKSVLNYMPRVLSCTTCLTCFHTIAFYVFSFFYVPSIFYVPYVLSLFTCLTWPHFLRALSSFFFFACLTCPYFLRTLLNVFITCLTCLTFLHFFIKYGATHNQPSQAGMSINEVEQTKNSK